MKTSGTVDPGRGGDRTFRFRQAGFSILEVVVAMVIIMFAISATMTGAGYATRIQTEAESNAMGAELAQYVLSRLKALPWNSLLLVDTTPNLLIGRWDTNGSKPADHGAVPEYNLIFQPWNVANSRAVYTGTDANGVAEVWYEGYSYHIAWNIDDNVPFVNAKTIEVIVQSPSYAESIANSSAPYNRQVRLNGMRLRSDS